MRVMDAIDIINYTGATRMYQDIQKSWVMPTLPKESAVGRPWGVQGKAELYQMQLAIRNGLNLVAGNLNFSIKYIEKNMYYDWQEQTQVVEGI